MPPIAMGYAHISPEYHIFEKDKDIKPEDVRVFEGVVNLNGNSAGDLKLDADMHRNYLLPVGISSCKRDGDEKNTLSDIFGK
jgi:hypothetical protein